MPFQFTRRHFLKTMALSVAGAGLACKTRASKASTPNFVIIFLDDSGWSDFRPFGDPAYETPNVNKLAEQGCRFTQFYVPQAVCSASRASLMTGCYPGRTKVFGAHPPRARGLDPKFETMGQAMQKVGYKTAVFGKWHLGDQEDTRPPVRGFDESCGLMYSNDMWEYHPVHPESYRGKPLQYWDNGEITIERVTPKEQTMLTTWYTEHAVDFIQRHKDEPFLLYVPHSMPHVPIYASEKFAGKSGSGAYGDVMMELDWSVGEIIKALHKNGLDDNTVVIFTSDNGPWISYGNHAGTTPYREAKATSFDGGTRSACIIRYPGVIKANTVSDDAFCSIDLFPTLCKLAGASLPDYEIDGKDVWDLVIGSPGAENPHEYYAFSRGRDFEAVMSGDGRWKLHLPHSYRTLEFPGADGIPGRYRQENTDFALFDLDNDPYETKNVIEQYPQIAERLQEFARAHQKKFYNSI